MPPLRLVLQKLEGMDEIHAFPNTALSIEIDEFGIPITLQGSCGYFLGLGSTLSVALPKVIKVGECFSGMNQWTRLALSSIERCNDEASMTILDVQGDDLKASLGFISCVNSSLEQVPVWCFLAATTSLNMAFVVNWNSQYQYQALIMDSTTALSRCCFSLPS